MQWESLLKGVPVASYSGAFLWAVASGIFSPCKWAIFPIVLSYVAYETMEEKSSKTQGFILSVAFVLGMTVTYSAMGAAISLVGGFLPIPQGYISLPAGILLIIIGLQFLGIYQIRLPIFLNAGSKPTKRKGVIGAVILGVFGAIFMGTCGISFLMPVLTVALEKGNVLFGTTLLFIYGLGHGLPLIVLGTVTGVATVWLRKAQSAKKYVDIVIGIALIGAGLYYLWQI